MKTERRHELKTNLLAAWLDGVSERARQHGNLLVTGVVVLLVVLLAGSVLVRRSRARATAAWTALTTANSPPELEAISADYPGSAAGAWGTLRAADIELAQGMRRLFTNREDALVNLRAANRAYKKLAGSSSDSLIDQRAFFGSAKSHEALGELEEAKTAYQAIIDRFPNGLFAGQAAARLKALEDPKTAEFYSWLERQGTTSSSATSVTPSTSSDDDPSEPLQEVLESVKPAPDSPPISDEPGQPAEEPRQPEADVPSAAPEKAAPSTEPN